MVELLKQGQYSPFSLEKQIASIWAGTTGNLDSVPVADIRRFESEFIDFLGRERKEIMTTISETKVLEDDTVAKLQAAIDDFKKIFKSTAASAANENEEDPLEGELQEQIVAVKK
jgi:F-type H+-transporting ATPase subunit alpha